MAEIEEAIEIAEECVEGAEEEAEGMSEEIKEEIEAEVAEARSEVAEFSKVAEALKTLAHLAETYIPKIAKFILKNAAIGAILWGVNVALNKIFIQHPEQRADVEKKRAAIKALTTVIKTETDLGKKTLEWMKEHQDDQITLEGFEVPLESVIAKYITPISEAVDSAFKIAKNLQQKLDGKVQCNIPTGEDMRELLTTGDAFLKGFNDLVAFISENVQKIKQLATFPVKQADIDLLTTQLKAAKDLPLW
ncbi:uncharacterized protein LOC110945682 [Acanthochromis polyacanthus]|uniref:uncharacterized protein LOC110945682 n=1 Tax=Acanthochromis polyacanthus TaxID=80966 RepID=UPI000B8F5A2A|nr:uncharacterized protein LOC110945682 [Acanthochromis polyacanthus]XP_051813334.1 uncharacterized protein LOC110945682 [Acanthochromis polyacanthus]